jgi:hypothetical protein
MTFVGEGQVYWGSASFKSEVRAAASRFEVTHEDRGVDVRVGEASAGTGSRYLAVVSLLPPTSWRGFAAPAVVSVLSPWPAVYPMHLEGYLHARYVGEKLAADRYRRGTINGGDWVALTLLVGRLLERPVDPVADLAGRDVEL